jgi:signal transduction histidine kinase
VEDDGCGIHPRDLPEAFTPFYSTKPNSIGIGLSVAKRIVEAHGGKIELKSVKDQGTQAAIFLPNA